MTTVTLIAPSGQTGGVVDCGPAGMVVIGADGTATVDSRYVQPLLRAGWRYFRTQVDFCAIQAPIAAELVSIVAAVTPTNTALTIAAQPDVPRKLQVRLVDDGTHHWTAGILTIVGTDARGNSVTETLSLVTSVSVTLKTANAYSHVTSATITNLAGAQSTDTIGIGVAADLALPLPQTFVDLTVYKESVAATGTASFADEAVGTVDTVAGTVSPTSAPTGAKNFAFWYTAGLAD